MTILSVTPSTFILASGSPRRRELLASLGVPFTVIKPDIDETQRAGEPPLAYVARLSREKAEAAALRFLAAQTLESGEAGALLPAASSVVLAADTIVVLAADTIGVVAESSAMGSGEVPGTSFDPAHDGVLYGEVLGKPTDAADARAMLIRLRARDHLVCTALTLQRWPGGEPDTCLTRTIVTMRDYTDAEIEAYLLTGDPFDKAGSYAIQHAAFAPVARIEGSYTNVVGLPIETLRVMLDAAGVPFELPSEKEDP